MSTSDLTGAIEQSHAALDAILKGDPSVYQALYSSADDVSLGSDQWVGSESERRADEADPD